MARPARQLGELAEALGLPLEGDAQTEITGAAGLDDAGPGELSFVTGPRYAKSFAASGAAAFIAPADFDAAGRTVTHVHVVHGLLARGDLEMSTLDGSIEGVLTFARSEGRVAAP